MPRWVKYLISDSEAASDAPASAAEISDRSCDNNHLGERPKVFG